MAEPGGDAADVPLFGDTPGQSEEDRDILRRARAKIAQLGGAPPVSKALQDRVASETGTGSDDDDGERARGQSRP